MTSINLLKNFLSSVHWQIYIFVTILLFDSQFITKSVKESLTNSMSGIKIKSETKKWFLNLWNKCKPWKTKRSNKTHNIHIYKNNNLLLYRQKFNLTNSKESQNKNRNKKGPHFSHFLKETKTIKLQKKTNIFEKFSKNNQKIKICIC